MRKNKNKTTQWFWNAYNTNTQYEQINYTCDRLLITTLIDKI